MTRWRGRGRTRRAAGRAGTIEPVRCSQAWLSALAWHSRCAWDAAHLGVALERFVVDKDWCYLLF